MSTAWMACLCLILILPGANQSAAHGLILVRQLPSTVQDCRYADALYDSDQAMVRQEPPTHFKLMPSRWVQIVEAARGKACAGTVTVAFNGHEFTQTGRTDDAGIAELIPMLASWLGLSLAHAFDLTVAVVIFAGAVIGYAGFWSMFPDPRLRWLGAAVFLLIASAEAGVANVYVFQSAPLVAGIPWVLHLARNRRNLAFNLSAFLLAFFSSWCSVVRIGTTLCCIAFLLALFLAMLFIGRASLQATLASLLIIALACLPAYLFERLMIIHRNVILVSLGSPVIAENHHSLWHSIYLGLAFLPNKEVPAYSDHVAVDRVRSIDPTAVFTSAAYETILRREVFRLARQRPMLVLANLLAKILIVMVLAAILLLPASKTFLAYRQELWVDAAFISVMMVSSLNAILVVPRRPYLLTFFCLTCLYSVVKFSMEQYSRNII